MELDHQEALGSATDRRAELIAQFERKFSRGAIRRRSVGRWMANWQTIYIGSLGGAKRLVDLALSGAALVILSPLLLSLHLKNKSGGGVVVRNRRLGRGGCQFDEFSFSGGPLRKLPSLLNVLKGDMAMVGPRAVEPGEFAPNDLLAWRRLNMRPGFLCLWWIRKRANIAYGTEFGADSEYLDTQSLRGDLGIALRAIPAAFYGEGCDLVPDHVDLLGIPVDNVCMEEAIEKIVSFGTRAGLPSQVCFVNADCVNIAARDAEYKRILQTSQLVLADGIGVKLAGKILNRNIRQNVNGTDMLPILCRALGEAKQGIFLLGGKPGVASDVADWMRKQFPGLRVCGHRHGFFRPEELSDVLAEINESGAEILLVAFGVPKQETWIRQHMRNTGARTVIGVGGLFDFYSGRIPRAPSWMREIGAEWLFRFWQEPRRMWRRYFVGNFVFLLRVLRDRTHGTERL